MNKWNIMRKWGVEYEFMNPKEDMFRMSKILNKLNIPYQIKKFERTSHNKAWIIKPDGSCSFELVSPVSSGIQDIESVSNILPILEQEGFWFNKKCGQHVHVSISDYNMYDFDLIIAWWIKIEYFFMNSVQRFRKKCHYCSALNNYADLPSHDLDCLQITKNTKLFYYGRKAINLENKITRQTIEFRYPNMTFDAEEMKNRIKFFIQFVEICKYASMPSNFRWMQIDDIILFLGLSSNSYPESVNMKKWMVEQYLKYADPNEFPKTYDRCCQLKKELESICAE